MLWSQFSAISANFVEKMAFFSKTNVMITIFAKPNSSLSKKHKNFRYIFWRKYFKDHNIGPRWACENIAQRVAQYIPCQKLMHGLYRGIQ
jgi:hypothetical protein